MKRIIPAQLKKLLETKDDLLLLDIRPPEVFADGFIPGSINITTDQFDHLLPYIISKKVEIIIIFGNDNDLEKVSSDFSDSLSINFIDWSNEEDLIDMIITIDAYEFGLDIKFDKSISIIDLRTATEHEVSHISDDVNIPLKDIPYVYDDFELTDQLYFYGTTLSEAMTAASLFKKQGYNLVKPIEGGFESIKNEQNIKLIKKKKTL